MDWVQASEAPQVLLLDRGQGQVLCLPDPGQAPGEEGQVAPEQVQARAGVFGLVLEERVLPLEVRVYPLEVLQGEGRVLPVQVLQEGRMHPLEVLQEEELVLPAQRRQE